MEQSCEHVPEGNISQEIINSAFEDAKKILNQKTPERKKKHTHTFKERSGMFYCECGATTEAISDNNEFFNYEGTRRVSRCNGPIKRSTKGIVKELENSGISMTIITQANGIFLEAMINMQKETGKSSRKGENRKSMILACISYVYKRNGIFIPEEHLAKKIGTSPGNTNFGVKVFREYLDPKKYPPIYESVMGHVKYLIMNERNKENIYQQIEEIYKSVDGKSGTLRRCKKKSFALALIYYYSRSKGASKSRSEFLKNASISQNTLSSLAKKIRQIRGENVDL